MCSKIYVYTEWYVTILDKPISIALGGHSLSEKTTPTQSLISTIILFHSAHWVISWTFHQLAVALGVDSLSFTLDPASGDGVVVEVGNGVVLLTVSVRTGQCSYL